MIQTRRECRNLQQIVRQMEMQRTEIVLVHSNAFNTESPIGFLAIMINKIEMLVICFDLLEFIFLLFYIVSFEHLKQMS